MFRRSFLKSAMALPVATALFQNSEVAWAQALSIGPAPPKNHPNDFDFVFFTDAHLQPELSAQKACARCFAQINSEKVEFCIAGGDQVFDICEQDLGRAHFLFKAYLETEKDLNGTVYHTIGNHDVTGINQKSPVEPGDLEYGKKLYEDHFGKRYYSFDHKGWHFIVLDSIGIEYYKIFKGLFDEEQLDWLKTDLAATGPKKPIIVVTHVPIATALGTLSHHHTSGIGPVAGNSWQVHRLLEGYNLKAILQGHLHVWQKSEFRGVQYLISGAVSGAWWRGPNEGTPEGYTLCQCRGDEIHLSYITYPWTAVADPQSA